MINKSEQLQELAKALCVVQGKLEAAPKDVQNKHLGNKYADLASVWGACRKLLTENGLSIAQLPTAGGEGVIDLQTILLHTSGQWIASETCMPVVKQPGVNDAQAYGLVLSYARRYALSAMVGIIQEDTDADTGEHSQTKSTARPPAPKPATPKPAAKPAASDPLAWFQLKCKQLGYADLKAWCAQAGVNYDGLLADKAAQKPVHDIILAEIAAMNHPFDEETP